MDQLKHEKTFICAKSFFSGTKCQNCLLRNKRSIACHWTCPALDVMSKKLALFLNLVRFNKKLTFEVQLTMTNSALRTGPLGCLLTLKSAIGLVSVHLRRRSKDNFFNFIQPIASSLSHLANDTKIVLCSHPLTSLVSIVGYLSYLLFDQGKLSATVHWVYSLATLNFEQY